jgi:hypothetical protein
VDLTYSKTGPALPSRTPTPNSQGSWITANVKMADWKWCCEIDQSTFKHWRGSRERVQRVHCSPTVVMPHHRSSAPSTRCSIPSQPNNSTPSQLENILYDFVNDQEHGQSTTWGFYLSHPGIGHFSLVGAKML